MTTLNFEEFAIVDVTIALKEPLDGTSGQSSFRLHVDGGIIWLDDEVRTPESVQDFTIRLRGETEHSILACAFREAAELLDPKRFPQQSQPIHF